MRIEVSRVDGSASPYEMQALNEAGRKLSMDGSPAIGGVDAGFRPMETLLAGLAGCSGIDVLSILAKSRQKVASFKVTVDAERAETDPKVFTKIRVHFRLTGEVDEKRLKQAVDLSMEKYCSVAAMLGKTAVIEASWEVGQTPVTPP